MYKIDIKKLEKELKIKRKHFFIALFFSIIINVVLFIVYYIITKKDNTFGIAALTLSILTVLLLLQGIKDIICLRKCISDAKYLINDGTLLKKQKINIKNTMFFFKPCLYYVDKNYKVKRLKIRHTIDLFSKGTLDLLIDIKNPKRYYIDTDIKTNSKYDPDTNNKPFKDVISYPGYVKLITDNNSLISNITTFVVLVAFFIYIGIIKDDTFIRGAALGASLVLTVESLRTLAKIIDNKKKIKMTKALLKNGKLYNNIKFKIDKKDEIAKTVIVKINHNDKDYKSDKIRYYPEKEKVSLLIDDKENYIIDYDINKIDKTNI